MIDLTTSLGDLVTQDPRRARVLDEHGLDYCCHGQRSLAQASEEKGLDAAALARALDLPDAPATPDWQGLGIGDLARHIVATHHRFLWDDMDRLAALATKVASVHGERHPELASIRDDYSALKADLEMHLTKEERILFPAIEQLDASGEVTAHCGVLGPIRQMMFEHDHAGELLASMRAASGDYAVPADGCTSYQLLMQGLAALEDDLHEHIHKENNVLFPRALAADGAAL